VQISSGLDDFGHPATKRRRDARERQPAVERLQKRSFLAVEIRVWTFEHLDVHRSRPARRPDLVDGVTHALDLERERPFQRDHDLRGVACVGGDQRALQDVVRVAAQDRPILERARLTFGGVHDHRGGQRRRQVLSHCPPFAARRKPGPASTAQSRRFDLLDQLPRIHGSRLVEARTAREMRDVLLERLDRLRMKNTMDNRHIAESFSARSRRDRGPSTFDYANSTSTIDDVISLMK
jgi:hypothetical protein